MSSHPCYFGDCETADILDLVFVILQTIVIIIQQGYEASLNCEGLELAETTAETGPPAESTDSAKWQRRRSRLAGRDHRRFYQERWKMDYLMDYDCLRHGLVCMVCGSTLATLKLSTIKRHILQKHQDTMLLTRSEKEVVIATWVEHLVNHSYQQEKPDALGLEPIAVHTDLAPVTTPALDTVPAELALSPEPAQTMPTLRAEGVGQSRKGGPPGKEAVPRRPGKPVRRYYQERWRTEYLMDYDCLRNGLVCMVCGSTLATLKLSTIKRHILQKHQASLSLTPSERDVVMASWVEHLLNQSQINIEQQGAGPDRLTQSRIEPQWAGPASGMADQSRPKQRSTSPVRLHQLQISAPALFDQSGFEQPGTEATWQHFNQSQPGGQEAGPASLHLNQSQTNGQGARQPSVHLNHSETVNRGTGPPSAHLNQSQPDSQGAGPPVFSLNQSQMNIGKREAAPALFNQSGFEARGTMTIQHFDQPQIDIKLQGAGSSQRFHQSHVEGQGAEPPYDLHQSEINVDQRGAEPEPPAVAELSDSLGASSIVKVVGFPVSVDQAQLPVDHNRVGEQWTVQHSPLARLSSKGVRRYYQQRWRVEHLMDYDWWRHGLVCMVCGKSLATLTLSTIKRHILQNHPHSLNFSQAEKENILEAWNERALQHDCTAVQLLMPGLGPSWSAGKRPRCLYQERWRFDYLMDYDRWWHTLVCMVCGKSLTTIALSTIKRHILQNHPHSLNFSQAEKGNILEAWNKTTSQQERAVIKPWTSGKGETPAPNVQAAVAGEIANMEFAQAVDPEWDGQRDGGRSPAEIEVCVEEQELSSPVRTVRGRVPGRDHWRNYQERWRLEYLMDYDRGRHGLVCMVCGSTLATLKLSTIKRHILQKHQDTMGFTLAEKVMVVEEWNKKITTIAKMDFWQLPSSGNGSSSQHPGVIITTQH
ncbi:uncharacterized protein C11orf95-like [Carcharodon carcharias]|uniref:uncharacterized protein C11orf95-like n=1 Tax=Carcharodon carcharias TaxID=13397 RepID=UPI001B7DE49B|nr:uncharacterized protein C11orf95-like [Carcharodon carcharias]